jgi:hypothetical protein
LELKTHIFDAPDPPHLTCSPADFPISVWQCYSSCCSGKNLHLMLAVPLPFTSCLLSANPMGSAFNICPESNPSLHLCCYHPGRCSLPLFRVSQRPSNSSSASALLLPIVYSPRNSWWLFKTHLRSCLSLVLPWHTGKRATSLRYLQTCLPLGSIYLAFPPASLCGALCAPA